MRTSRFTSMEMSATTAPGFTPGSPGRHARRWLRARAEPARTPVFGAAAAVSDGRDRQTGAGTRVQVREANPERAVGARNHLRPVPAGRADDDCDALPRLETRSLDDDGRYRTHADRRPSGGFM